ncbi:MAG: manganese ABC transporter ATP-binding protein [Planctomycetota bacterium]|nr:MAG: manganese ABC transporter ATP-binding protein [Planctomycetota bacterium]
MGGEVLLRLHGAAVGYRGRPVLAQVELAVCRGDFLGIVGPNGAGKTTLLRTLLGILPPLAGALERAAGVRCGYVPQRRALDPIFPLTVRDVVAMGRYPQLGLWGRLGREHRAAIERALAELEIEALADRPYRELSGGQQQRAIMARALAAEPDVLLLDEPTEGMDLRVEAEVLERIAGLHARGRTIVLVSHELETVANLVGQLALVHGGRLRAGPAGELLRSEVLSELYGCPVTVERLGGRIVIGTGSRRAPPPSPGAPATGAGSDRSAGAGRRSPEPPPC